MYTQALSVPDAAEGKTGNLKPLAKPLSEAEAKLIDDGLDGVTHAEQTLDALEPLRLDTP